MVNLTLGLSTMTSRMLRNLCSLGRVFGKLRFLSEWLSFCGQLLMVRFLLWIISCLGAVFWQISVVCVVVMGNLWTIYFFIVQLHTHYGLLFFMLSAFIGSCQALWWVCYFAGINGLAWESYFVYLELGSGLFDVDCMVGTKLLLLWGHWEDVGRVKSPLLV